MTREEINREWKEARRRLLGVEQELPSSYDANMSRLKRLSNQLARLLYLVSLVPDDFLKDEQPDRNEEEVPMDLWGDVG